MNKQHNYINERYKDLGILKSDFGYDWFNPSIYPDEGYIPFCSICDNDFSNFKTSNMKVEMKHPNSCLWYIFYIEKIKNICPSAIIIRNKK